MLTVLKYVGKEQPGCSVTMRLGLRRRVFLTLAVNLWLLKRVEIKDSINTALLIKQKSINKPPNYSKLLEKSRCLALPAGIIMSPISV